MEALTDNQILKWCVALGLSAIAVTAPIHPILITVGVLVAADTILGVWASIKKNERLTSSRAGRVVTKMFIYELVLCVLFAVEQNVWGDLLPAVKLAAGAICLVEVISLLENASAILGQPVFKFLINKLGSKSLK